MNGNLKLPNGNQKQPKDGNENLRKVELNVGFFVADGCMIFCTAGQNGTRYLYVGTNEQPTVITMAKSAEIILPISGRRLTVTASFDGLRLSGAVHIQQGIDAIYALQRLLNDDEPAE